MIRIHHPPEISDSSRDNRIARRGRPKYTRKMIRVDAVSVVHQKIALRIRIAGIDAVYQIIVQTVHKIILIHVVRRELRLIHTYYFIQQHVRE